jgi:AraC family transcriptional regulator
MRLPPDFIHGEFVRGRRVGELTLVEVRHPPRLAMRPLAHANARFILVLRGTLVETAAGRACVHQASTLLFRPAGGTHALAAADRECVCLIADMGPSWMARAREESRVIEAAADLRGGLLLHLAHRLYGEFRLRDEMSRLAIESLALGVLAEASRRRLRAARTAPRWLERAQELVRARFPDRPTLAQLAESVGVHPVHLARTFRERYRCTLGEYVRQLRLEFARHELVTSGASFAEIALAAGFCDQSHLTRLFKRSTGMTPAEYRLLHRARGARGG